MEQETYPLVLDGALTGKVAVHCEGGWTCFDVNCAALEGIVRISVYGDGKEGYLGVLAPEGGGMALHRRLSRSDLRGFPAQIAYAGRAGQPCGAEADTEQTTETKAPPEAPAPPETENETAATEGTERETEPAPPRQEAQAETEKGSEAPSLEDVYWYASPDGALVCFDGTENLIALPVGDPRIPDGPGGWPRNIERQDYIVYRMKDGKLLR